MSQGKARAAENGAGGIRVGSISLETTLWIVLILVAIVTRFYDLGSRALHHDEGLHAYYSWLLAEGRGYVHNPLMHGPFLFHIDALFYLLFGDSDAVSRAPAALAGVVLVGLPWFLRDPRYLRRWGALASSLFILTSPSILYFTRFIRHDPFTLVGVMLLFICIVRYLDRPERKWLITGSVAIAFLLANHEIVFANLVLFFGFLYVVLAIDRIRVWLADPARRSGALIVLAAHGVALIGLPVVLVLSPSSAVDEILDIPWQNPTNQEQIDYYERLASNPLVLGAIAVALISLATLVIGLRRARSGGVDDGAPAGALLGDAPDGGVAAGVRSAWRDATGLGLALLAGVALFTLLFTSLFTHLPGLATATFATDGTLLYWLGQHEVQRGSQPWFYYLVLMPQYDYIVTIFGFLAAALVIVNAIRHWRGGGDRSENLLMQGLLVTWFLGIFAGLSYAGEKMPWLVIHIALPSALLAGRLVGAVIERALAERRAGRLGRSEWVLGVGLLVAGVAWVTLASLLTRPIVQRSSNDGLVQQVSAWSVDHWWLLAIPPVGALVALLVAVVLRGPQRAALATTAALLVGLLVMQVHAGARMSYLEGDVPRDMLVYTQTSPDLPMVVDDLARLSLELHGDLSLEVLYDSRVAWPLMWYMRDFTGKRLVGSGPDSPTAPALILSTEQYNQMSGQLEGYTAFDYVLRGWFPEEMYRYFAIAPELDPPRSAWGSAEEPHGPVAIVESIIESIAGHDNPAAQQELYRLFMHRELTSPNGQYRFKLMIRNDLVPVFNGIRL
ncbi:MAG: TIGR03663 family protein [Thermomicrobiales bacterium]|nr:TIGR03663 family protein [Thermomicrobiales bacterium]